MKGAFTITTAIAAAAGLMGVATVVGIFQSGPVSDIIEMGEKSVKDQSYYTINVDSKDKLSDLAMLVYHRASNDGCKIKTTEQNTRKCANLGGKHPYVACQIKNPSVINDKSPQKYWYKTKDEKGYPHLKDTYLGQYPSCPSSSSTAVAGPLETVKESGQDMEGIFSRERFVIDKPMVLVTNDPRTWLENRLRIYSKEPFRERMGQCSENTASTGSPAFSLHMTGDTEVVTSRAKGKSWYVNRATDHDDSHIGAFCKDDGTVDSGHNPEIKEKKFKQETHYLKLCPGDKGYIQVNKGNPLNDGEAGEGSGNDAKKFPHIQLTKLNKSDSCKLELIPPEIKIKKVVGSSENESLMMKVDVTNRKDKEHEIDLKMIQNKQSDYVIGGKRKTIGPGKTKTFYIGSLNEGGPLNPESVKHDQIHVYVGCKIKIKAEEVDGPGRNTHMEDITLYTDTTKGGLIDNDECQDDDVPFLTFRNRDIVVVDDYHGKGAPGDPPTNAVWREYWDEGDRLGLRVRVNSKDHVPRTLNVYSKEKDGGRKFLEKQINIRKNVRGFSTAWEKVTFDSRREFFDSRSVREIRTYGDCKIDITVEEKFSGKKSKEAVSLAPIKDVGHGCSDPLAKDIDIQEKEGNYASLLGSGEDSSLLQFKLDFTLEHVGNIGTSKDIRIWLGENEDSQDGKILVKRVKQEIEPGETLKFNDYRKDTFYHSFSGHGAARRSTYGTEEQRLCKNSKLYVEIKDRNDGDDGGWITTDTKLVDMQSVMDEANEAGTYNPGGGLKNCGNGN